jgi:hypothetical protein
MGSIFGAYGIRERVTGGASGVGVGHRSLIVMCCMYKSAGMYHMEMRAVSKIELMNQCMSTLLCHLPLGCNLADVSLNGPD